MKGQSFIPTVAIILAIAAIGILFVLARSDLSAATGELSSTKAALSSVQEELSATKDELAASKLALAQATTQVGYRDPTYMEVRQFLQDDQTDQNQYIKDVYDCHNFAADVNLNAEAKGIRAAYVSIAFPDTGHAIVAFNTVDKGILYIEPQHDDEVLLTIGESYSNINGYQEPTTYDDTIVSYTVIW